MKPLEFNSCLAPEIQRFIKLRQLSGTEYQSQARLLMYFDRFLIEEDLKDRVITRQVADRYLETLSRLAIRAKYNYFCVVRQLCRYLSSSIPHTHIPEQIRTISPQDAHHPYIYSESQIHTLLAAASKLLPANSLRPHTYRTLLGLLYSTGIRIGEAIDLNLEDFYPAEKRIHIADGKFHKARWIPLAASTSRVLQRYLERRASIKPCSPDSPLFLNQRSRRLHECTVNHTFRPLLGKCEITPNKHAGPRIHDLRHTFAVHRLLSWYRDGQDVNARLPWLATYMGHVNIHSTQVYLRATPELIEHVSQRFHKHYLIKVKTMEDNNEP
jgi:site-specific recombinase XerD